MPKKKNQIWGYNLSTVSHLFEYIYKDENEDFDSDVSLPYHDIDLHTGISLHPHWWRHMRRGAV